MILRDVLAPTLLQPPEVLDVHVTVDDYGWLTYVETIRVTCASCFETVERPQVVSWWTNPPMPRHCSKACAKRETERRRRGRKAGGVTVQERRDRSWTCPRPDKVRYGDRQSAYAYRIAAHPWDSELRPYECRCGWWHLGHSHRATA